MPIPELVESEVATFSRVRFSEPYRIMIRDLKVSACVGVYPHEHDSSQPLLLNLTLKARRGGKGLGVPDYAEIIALVRRLVEQGHVALLEDLAEAIVENCLHDDRITEAVVRIEKLAAIADAAAVGVEVRGETAA